MEEIGVPTIAIYGGKDYPYKKTFLIKSKEFKKCAGDTEPSLYYSGELYDIKRSKNPQLPPVILKYATTIINVPREDIITLD